MHQEIAATFTASHTRRLFTQLSFLQKAWDLYGNPSGERKPKVLTQHVLHNMYLISDCCF